MVIERTCTASWDGGTCDRRATTKTGLCGAHYQQGRKGGTYSKPRNVPKKYGSECHFQGCDNHSGPVGLCGAHYKMMAAKGVLRPLYTHQRRRGTAVSYDEFGNKQCASCRQYLPVLEFGRSARAPDKLRGTCTSCRAATERSVDDVVVAKANRYGVTPEWIYSKFAELGGACPGCTAEFSSITEVNIDHDHSCCGNDGSCGDCVRGLLCGPCNRGLGMLRDNKNTLTRLHAYLVAYEEETN